MLGQPLLSKSAAAAAQCIGSQGAEHAGLCADVGESAITVVAIEQVLAALQARWTARDLDALVGAICVFGQRSGLYIEVDVVADEEVEVAVFVVVEKCAAGVPAQAILEQASLLGYVGKSAVAVVAEERILAVVADEEIVPAVVVVVAHAAGLAPAAAGEAGLECDVGKRAVAIVFEEMANRLLAFGKAFEAPAVDEENVDPVVVVVVEEGRAAACGFKQIFVAMLAAEDGLDVEAGFFGHVGELHAKRRACDGRRQAFGGRASRGFVDLARVAGGLLRRRCLLPERGPRQMQNIFERQNKRSPGERLQESTAAEVGKMQNLRSP